MIILEHKELNAHVKHQLLDDFQHELRAQNKQNTNYNRMNVKDAQLRTREMQSQTINCIAQTINKLSSTEEYKLVQLNGEWIKGPMKWMIMVLGPNHTHNSNQAKDLSSLMKQEYKNLNIIIIKITND